MNNAKVLHKTVGGQQPFLLRLGEKTHKRTQAMSPVAASFRQGNTSDRADHRRTIDGGHPAKRESELSGEQFLVICKRITMNGNHWKSRQSMYTCKDPQAIKCISAFCRTKELASEEASDRQAHKR